MAKKTTARKTKAAEKLAAVHKLAPKHLLTATVMVTLAEFPNGEVECLFSPLEVSAHYVGAGSIKVRGATGFEAADRALTRFLREAGVQE